LPQLALKRGNLGAVLAPQILNLSNLPLIKSPSSLPVACQSATAEI